VIQSKSRKVKYRRDFTSFNCIDNMWICINKVSRFRKGFGVEVEIHLQARRSMRRSFNSRVPNTKYFAQKLAMKQWL